jgi:xylulokinase
MDVADLEGALSRVVADLGPDRERVAAIGVAGMAESGAPLTAGRPVAPIIAWYDGRGEETIAALQRRFGPELARRTGRRLRTVSSVAKLGWLLDHGLTPPERWLGVPELTVFLLTGVEVTEHSLAARTGAYDVIERAWLPAVAGELGLGIGVFPDVRPAGSPMGWIPEAAGRRFGLPTGVPVTIAGHDHLAAGAGLGTADDDLLNSVGTAETVFRRTPRAPDVDEALALDLAVTVWPGGQAWSVLASAARSGLVLGELAAGLGRSPAELDRLAAGGDAGPGSPGARWAAVLSDLAARTAAAGARVAELLGPHRRLVVFGGGSRSVPWLAAKAAAGVPVVRSPVAEAAVRGAALAAGVAAGWWPRPGDGPAPVLEAPVPGARVGGAPVDGGGPRPGTMGGP